jgi:hypothetical protein
MSVFVSQQFAQLERYTSISTGNAFVITMNWTHYSLINDNPSLIIAAVFDHVVGSRIHALVPSFSLLVWPYISGYEALFLICNRNMDTKVHPIL